SCDPGTIHIRRPGHGRPQGRLQARPAVGARPERGCHRSPTDRRPPMNDTFVTLRGWLGTDVRYRQAGDSPVAEFRLGVTPRYYDRERSAWADGATVWYTVKAWRQLADNCRDSLQRADPVMVHG